MSWVAYVDESIRSSDGIYILAAAMIDDAEVDRVREAVRALAPAVGQRFHWRDEKPAGRHAATAAVADLPSLHVVVIGAPVDSRRQERARKRCLESLLFHLEAAGVEQVWLESRNTVADRRDITAVDQFRARQVIAHTIRVDHGFPLKEPLLWLADIVAGAISAAEGRDEAYRDLLRPLLTESRIQLD